MKPPRLTTSDDILAELRRVKQMIDETDFDNEPLYVDEEEWEMIRRTVTPAPLSLSAAFTGKRVVIDPAKALERRAREKYLRDMS